mmetsp:Transcript_20206/g.57951  ORF Transcript_20206/g.57951 Transcript_20206/m.57951 type:complete len:411 (-) Transcript_20206:1138-2370(-)
MATARTRSPLAVQLVVAWIFLLIHTIAGFAADRHIASSPFSSQHVGVISVTTPASFSSSSSLAALVYMPDGTVMQDDDEDLASAVRALDSELFESDLSQRSQDALLKHLNGKDMRGPLAILSAANGDISLGSIESVAVRGISSKSVYIETICSREDMHCVNVPVMIDFPKACVSDAEILATCNELYQKASAKLERAKVKTGLVVSFNPGRGFGFIALKIGPDVYVHHSNIKMQGYRTLRVGQTVEFKTGKDTKRGTGREYAYDVVLLKEAGTDKRGVGDVDKRAKKEIRAKRVEKEIPAKVDVEKPKASKSTTTKAKLEIPAKIEKPKATKAKQSAEKKDDASDLKSEEKRLEEALASKPLSKDYASMEVGERAFHVLLDLGLIALTPDPDDPAYDHSQDDEFAEFTTIG